MKRKQVCEILNINNSLITRVISGQRKSSFEIKIKFLLKFEDNFEAIVRDDSFGELCDIVIKRATVRKESKEVELAMAGRSLRNFLLNNFDVNDLEHSVLVMFDRESYLDRKMVEFINAEYLEKMCDIAMRCTRKLSIRKMATTLKLIHQEFWKPKLKSPANAVSKV